jgi:hypothetical protein
MGHIVRRVSAPVLSVIMAIALAPTPGQSAAVRPDPSRIHTHVDFAEAQPYLRDRGDGVPTSLVGTYVGAHQLLVYPFYEYTINADQEYKPSELGYGLEHDFRGQRVDHEALLLISYGLNDRVAFELESAVHAWATQRKSVSDSSAMPTHLSEDGFGDTQAEVRWKWAKETVRRPEVFSYFETVFPLQKQRVLIGTSEWELTQGFGLIKGFGFGTLTARASVSYTSADQQVVFGEYDLEYLKRTSPHWRWGLSVEGEQDELECIPEAQWHVRPNAFIKLNTGFGLTSKTPDLAPEVGAVFMF